MAAMKARQREPAVKFVGVCVADEKIGRIGGLFFSFAAESALTGFERFRYGGIAQAGAHIGTRERKQAQSDYGQAPGNADHRFTDYSDGGEVRCAARRRPHGKGVWQAWTPTLHLSYKQEGDGVIVVVEDLAVRDCGTAEIVEQTGSVFLKVAFVVSNLYRELANITTGEQRRQAMLQSAALWHAWPATSYTRREEQRDLAAASQ
jgi:hypothetical protein